MDPVLTVAAVGLGIVVLMFLGVPIKKPFKWLGNGAVRIMVGALALFLVNLFGNLAGLHMPINLFTSAVTGFLGIPGVFMLFAVHLLVLPG
ncbi:pro-sigmaK processing inhibitor BofA family protein [Natribacillus halophilus]|uniref:Inhibitor of the pro-sigma K processing machinery n=1 Tax=Natribacillus halophilus TaxID=549003 RepID=A0A1G8SQZ8_9BACI|nr:pro-sigmaK processing inhibitor BofA family protein [Natribacillus halophilus]SDJ31651.1 inhibitor of the pro-sigma K processing machinery [Natribacillus halophilus]